MFFMCVLLSCELCSCDMVLYLYRFCCVLVVDLMCYCNSGMLSVVVIFLVSMVLLVLGLFLISSGCCSVNVVLIVSFRLLVVMYCEDFLKCMVVFFFIGKKI